MNLPQFLIESINDQLINFNAKLDGENSYKYQRIIMNYFRLKSKVSN